jgi:hypothetical protein
MQIGSDERPRPVRFCKTSPKPQVARVGRSSKRTTEVFDGDSGLTKDRSKCPAGELVMKRDNRSPSCLVAKLHVTAALADLLEAQPLKCPDRLAAGYDRQPVCHALRSSVAMIGGSISVGSG